MTTTALWLPIAILAPTFWAMTNVFDGALRKEIIKDDLTLTWLQGAMKLPLLIFFFAVGGFEFPGIAGFFMMLLAGICLTLPIFLYFKAMEHEEVSRVALVMQLVPLFTIFIAYFLIGEQLKGAQLVSFLFLFGGGILAVLKRKKEKWHVSKYLLLVLIAAFFWALSDVLFKKYEVAFSNFNAAFAIYTLGSFLVAFTLGVYANKKEKIGKTLKKFDKKAWGLMIGSVLVGNLGTLCFNYALTLKEASLTAALMGLQPLVAFILGWMLYGFIKEIKRENMSKVDLLLKGSSFILILLGIIWLQLN